MMFKRNKNHDIDTAKKVLKTINLNFCNSILFLILFIDINVPVGVINCEADGIQIV